MNDSAKLDLLLSGMQEMKGDIHLLKEDVSGLKEDVSGLKEDVQTLKEDVSGLKEDVQTLKEDVKNLDLKTDAIQNKVVYTNLILENEIRVNIQRVAEGHLDLSRNLHDAIRSGNEIEALTIRVGILESDMKKVKAKLA